MCCLFYSPTGALSPSSFFFAFSLSSVSRDLDGCRRRTQVSSSDFPARRHEGETKSILVLPVDCGGGVRRSLSLLPDQRVNHRLLHRSLWCPRLPRCYNNLVSFAWRRGGQIHRGSAWIREDRQRHDPPALFAMMFFTGFLRQFDFVAALCNIFVHGVNKILLVVICGNFQQICQNCFCSRAFVLRFFFHEHSWWCLNVNKLDAWSLYRVAICYGFRTILCVFCFYFNKKWKENRQLIECKKNFWWLEIFKICHQ